MEEFKCCKCENDCNNHIIDDVRVEHKRVVDIDCAECHKKTRYIINDVFFLAIKNIQDSEFNQIISGIQNFKYQYEKKDNCICMQVSGDGLADLLLKLNIEEYIYTIIDSKGKLNIFSDSYVNPKWKVNPESSATHKAWNKACGIVAHEIKSFEEHGIITIEIKPQ